MRGWTRPVTLALAALLGAWMAFDGARALLLGDYVTPASGPYAGQLGPWARLVEAVGLAPRSAPVKLAVLAVGLVWLAAAAAVAARAPWARRALALAAPLALWYAPFGTLIALAVLALLARRDPRASPPPQGRTTPGAGG